MLVDTHAHLDDRRFDDDREEVIKRCEEEGLVCIINPGSNLSSSIKALSLAAARPIIFAAVGIHPHDAKNRRPKHCGDFAAAGGQREKVVAIGEIGLDYHYDFRPATSKNRSSGSR